MSEDRFISLETKIEYHEKTINDLNDVVYNQQKQIDKMALLIEYLKGQIVEISSSISDSVGNEKPPHY